jgi:hypothetical protein
VSFGSLFVLKLFFFILLFIALSFLLRFTTSDYLIKPSFTDTIEPRFLDLGYVVTRDG